MASPTRSLQDSLSARPQSRLLFARVLSSTLACSGLIGFLGGAGGCYSRPGPPEPASEAFTGCQMSVDSTGREYVIVAQVASPGYALDLDSTWEAYHGKHVYVTLRRPDARFAYAQVTTELRLLTQVETKESIVVFARIAERDERDVENDYQEAARFTVEKPQGAGRR